MLRRDIADNALAVFDAARGISDDSFTPLDARVAADDLLDFFHGRGGYRAGGLLKNAASFFLAWILPWPDA
ncbi:MAG: hypothetical protein ACYDAG_19265 [Chloroflexota bacterium]